MRTSDNIPPPTGVVCQICSAMQNTALPGHKFPDDLLHEKCCANPTRSLCAICRHTRIPHMMLCCADEVLWLEDGIPWGSLKEIKKRSSKCRFCRFMCEFITKRASVIGLNVSISDNTGVYFDTQRREITVYSEEQLMNKTLLFQLDIASWLRRSRWFTQSLDPQRCSPNEPETLSRLVDWKEIQYFLTLKLEAEEPDGWLTEISSNHTGVNTAVDTPSEWPVRMKLIDVEKGLVVEANTRCKYMCLSYVWGNSQAIKVPSSGILEVDRLPLTIHDAMIACANLGERYLWVDQVCIDQESSTELHEQINQMHLIYQNAEYTLVALAGDHAGYGLPGVTEPRSWHFSTVVIDRLLGADIAPSFDEILLRSPWFSRGWAFQELLFSQKVLYFAETGIQFEYRLSGQHGHLSETHSTSSERGGAVTAKRGYRGLLEPYTTRTLRYKHDVLRAFTAALRASYGNETYYGLPLQCIEQAIAWVPHGHASTHRTGFPSWSWTSHSGRIVHVTVPAGLAIWAIPRPGAPGEIDICKPSTEDNWARESQCRFFSWSTVIPNLVELWLAGCINAPFPPKLSPQYGRYGAARLRWPTYNAYYQDVLTAYSSRRVFSRHPIKTVGSQAGRILVHSKIAQFRIRPSTLSTVSSTNDCFLIYDKSNNLAGFVTLPQCCQASLPDGNVVEFLSLSLGLWDDLESEKDLAPSIRDVNQKYKNVARARNDKALLSYMITHAVKLNVMPIARNPTTNVAHRLGMGYVWFNEWTEADPVFMTIVME